MLTRRLSGTASCARSMPVTRPRLTRSPVVDDDATAALVGVTDGALTQPESTRCRDERARPRGVRRAAQHQLPARVDEPAGDAEQARPNGAGDGELVDGDGGGRASPSGENEVVGQHRTGGLIIDEPGCLPKLWRTKRAAISGRGGRGWPHLAPGS